MEAKIIRWVDGDTCRAHIYIGGVLVFMNVNVRVKGLDCPELQGYNLEKALRALEFVTKEWPPGSCLSIDGTLDIDRYGRFVASLKDNGIDIAEVMIQKGLCRRSNY